MRSRSVRCLWMVGVVLAACGGAAPSALGFGTVWDPQGFFGSRTEHERITRVALACPAGVPSDGRCFEPASLDQVAGQTFIPGVSGTFGAVGAPDTDDVFTAAAHCDGADFLDDKYVDSPAGDRPEFAGDPRPRQVATDALRACHRFLRARARQGIAGAAALVDEAGRIPAQEVDINPSCTFTLEFSGDAKCNAIEGFGRALHGTQDFYSHSNWTDVQPTGRIGIKNPPGLNLPAPAPMTNLRLLRLPPVGRDLRDLATGCFGICRGRIKHGTLNKDLGLIEVLGPLRWSTSKVGTARGKIERKGMTNFHRAVRGAIRDTRDQWEAFRNELMAEYAPKRGAKAAQLMICAMTRDDPVRDCQGRRLAIAIDSSGSNQDTDPSNQRVAAGQAFNSSLLTQEAAGSDTPADLSAVIDFDSSARVCSPLADPSQADFSCIDSSGGTSIASGVRAATAELTRDASAGAVRDRSGIVILTDGLDEDRQGIVNAINDAAALGIRVSEGFLQPPANPVSRRNRPITSAQSEGPPPALVRAILDSGGVYAPIASAEDQDAFIRLVNLNGATNIDDPTGADDGGALVADVGSSGVVTGRRDRDRFMFIADAGRIVDFSLEPLVAHGLSATVTEVRTGRVLRRTRGAVTDRTFLRTRPRVSGPLEVTVESAGGVAPPTSTGALFTLGVAELGRDLRGSDAADVLRCTATATYVSSGAGRDVVRCGGGHDLIDGDQDADDLAGGDGNDHFVVHSKDLQPGEERIDGGRGKDRLELPFAKPRGVRCDARTTGFARGAARWTVRDVERIVFKGRGC